MASNNEVTSHTSESSQSVNSDVIDAMTERTPLLSPDDPRVSPLNIANVKLLRFSLNCLLIFNISWFVVSLISYFVSIPGFDSHGKSFFEFSFIFVSLYVNFLSFVFFLTPSDLTIDKWLNCLCLAMVTFDIFWIVVFPVQRAQYGVSEYLAMVFAVFSIGLNLASNNYVLKAKEHEEVRLTGRIETRKTFLEHISIVSEFVLKLVVILYVCAITMNVFLKAIDSAVAKPWGDLVSTDDNASRIHLFCQGEVYKNKSSEHKQPVVLVESGHESSEEFATWIQELYQLNKLHRYCVYDRPGFGFSDSSPSPYSLGVNAEMLSSVLYKSEIEGPFLVVAHGIGGLYGRVFASRRVSDIHSMLLVDAWPENLLLTNPFKNSKNPDRVLPREIPRLNRRYGLKVWLRGVFSAVNLKSYYDLIVHHRTSSARIFGEDMILQGKYLRVLLQEQVSASLLSYNELKAVEHSLKDADKQVSVVSSKFLIKQSLNWGNWQRELTKLSSNAHNEWVLTESGYRVWRYGNGKRKLQRLLLRMLGEADDLL